MKFAIYARYSSDQQDAATIETQIQECSRKVAALGGEVVKIFRDEAHSGRVEDRPEFQRMIADARMKPRPFDAVIVRKFDRFARDVTISRIYKSALKQKGIRVYSVHEDLDSDTASGALLEGILENLAEFYSRNLANETKSGQATNTRRGFRCGGEAPYGYKNKPISDPEFGKTRTTLEINPEEAEVIRHIFHRFADGLGMKAILRELEAKGYRPRRARGWAVNTIHAWLSNEVYVGTLVWKRDKDPATWVRTPGAVPAIITPEIWHRVQKRLEKGRVEYRSRSISQSNHPFAGMIFCEECGGRFVIGSNPRNKGWYLVCRNHRDTHTCGNKRHIRESDLISGIKKLLMGQILTPSNIRKALLQHQEELSRAEREAMQSMARLTREREILEKHQSRLMDELLADSLPRDVVNQKLKEIAEKKAIIITRIEEAHHTAGRACHLEVTDEDVRVFLNLLKQRLEKAEDRDLRDLLETLHLKITVCEDRLKVETASGISEGCPNGTSAGSGT